MGSEVKFIDYATDRVEQVRLVYPEEADESRGWVSSTQSAALSLDLVRASRSSVILQAAKRFVWGYLTFVNLQTVGLARRPAGRGADIATGNGAAPCSSTVLATRSFHESVRHNGINRHHRWSGC